MNPMCIQIHTIRLQGQISQRICINHSVLPVDFQILENATYKNIFAPRKHYFYINLIKKEYLILTKNKFS